MRKLFKKESTDMTEQIKETGVAQEKKKKKMSRKKKILIAVAVCVLGLFLYGSLAGANQKPMVVTAEAKRQDLNQILDTSGTVVSDKVVDCFAPVSVKIGEVQIEKGEVVKKGEVVVAYDETALSEFKKITQLNLQANRGSYQDSVEKNGKQQAMYTEATTNMEVLKQQISDTQSYIDSLQKKLDDKKAALARHGSLLEISRIDWADRPDSPEYQNLLKLIQENAYEQQNHPELKRLQGEIEQNTRLLNQYKEYESEMKAQKGSSETGKLSAGGKAQMEANAEVERLKLEKTMDSILANEQGIAAQFNGVVTAMEAKKGKIPQEGELLFTLESLEDVAVSLSVSKYDLEKLKVGQEAKLTITGKTYQGKVDRIEQMATKNANGATVVGVYIKVLNPDENLFLGVEAKVVVSTGTVQGAITIPIEAVNTDVNGQFVYVVEDGAVVKRGVETGLTTNLEIEIKKGVEEGEQVITETGGEVFEGMPVSTRPAD